MQTLLITLSLALVSVTLAQNCKAGFRPFEHFGGTSCVPEDPQRIVTTQDQNALLPLLELGIKPVGSAGLLLEDGGYQFRRVDGYDTSDIGFIGHYWGEANLESIVMLQPDLIIGDEFAEQFYDLQSQIAPTVMIQIFDRPLTEALLDFARLVKREARAKELEAAYNRRIAEFLEKLGERKKTLSIAIITPGEGGVFYRGDSGQAVGTVMDALDLLRPEPQATRDNDDAEYQSVEFLKAHDADVMLIFSFGGEARDEGVESFVASPIFQSLEVAKAQQVYVIDGTQTVGAAWGKMTRFVDELERILLNPNLRSDVILEE